MSREPDPDFVTVNFTFETHATSLDNEAGIASGHIDSDLSDLGIQQARDLGARYANERFAAVVCSDLTRSYRTGEIAFGSRSIPILRDPRLRECDYGSLNGSPADLVERERSRRIHQPFPEGESYDQAVDRTRAMLSDLAANYPGQRVMLIGHRATWYSLEHLLGGVPLRQTIETPWVWQPGWAYQLTIAQGSHAGHQETVNPGDAISIRPAKTSAA